MRLNYFYLVYCKAIVVIVIRCRFLRLTSVQDSGGYVSFAASVVFNKSSFMRPF